MSNENNTKPGATGRFPKGKLNEHDEGELAMAVGRKDDNIVIDFGSPVTWFALPPKQARAFAELVIKHAEEIEADAGKAQ